MKSPLVLRGGALVLAVLGFAALPLVGWAEDLTPPVLVKPIANLTVAAGTKQSVVNLKKTFGLSGVTGPVVRMATVLGNIDIELLSSETPKNVANFLSYVNSGEYNKTFIHRSEPNFVIQGGGYYVTSTNNLSHIAQGAAVMGEHVRSNTRGTLALALSSGPNSGTSEWFFNLIDNTVLDGTADGGPFTVFARVIEGDMATVDAIAAVETPHPSAFANTAFYDIPLIDYNESAGVQISNLVTLNDVVVVPLVPNTEGADAVLKLKVKNNNPSLVTATITGKKLKLVYAAGQTGTASIKVIAKDSTGTQTKSKFTVTVQ